MARFVLEQVQLCLNVPLQVTEEELVAGFDIFCRVSVPGVAGHNRSLQVTDSWDPMTQSLDSFERSLLRPDVATSTNRLSLSSSLVCAKARPHHSSLVDCTSISSLT